MSSYISSLQLSQQPTDDSRWFTRQKDGVRTMSRDVKVAVVVGLMFLGSVGAALIYKGAWPGSLNLEQLAMMGQTPPSGGSPVVPPIGDSNEEEQKKSGDSETPFVPPTLPVPTDTPLQALQKLERIEKDQVPVKTDPDARDLQESDGKPAEAENVNATGSVPVAGDNKNSETNPEKDMGPVLTDSLPRAPIARKSEKRPIPGFNETVLPPVDEPKNGVDEVPSPVLPVEESAAAVETDVSTDAPTKPQLPAINANPLAPALAPSTPSSEKVELSEEVGKMELPTIEESPVAPELTPAKLPSETTLPPASEEPKPAKVTVSLPSVAAPAKKKKPDDGPGINVPPVDSPVFMPKEEEPTEALPTIDPPPTAVKSEAGSSDSPPPIAKQMEVAPASKPVKQEDLPTTTAPPNQALSVDALPTYSPTPTVNERAMPANSKMEAEPTGNIPDSVSTNVPITKEPPVNELANNEPESSTSPSPAATLGLPQIEEEQSRPVAATLKAPSLIGSTDDEMDPGRPSRRINEDRLEVSTSENKAEATESKPLIIAKTDPLLPDGSLQRPVEPSREVAPQPPAEPEFELLPTKKPSELYAPVDRKEQSNDVVRVNRPPLGYRPDTGSVAVRTYAVKGYVVLRGDTFDGVSRTLFGTPQYGPALRFFNRSQYYRDSPLPDGTRIRYTEAVELERQFARLSANEVRRYEEYSQPQPEKMTVIPRARPVSQQQQPTGDSVAHNTVYSPPEQFKRTIAAATHMSTADSSIYTTTQQEALYAIASKTLGSGSRWREIADLNSDVLAPNQMIAPAGTTLKIPVQK